ncbi:MAG: DUF1513 domain-containing protein [Pseudomonadales bacterium]|nr:DUF1513 domain-containing protein [Pseudomonadales bacterium]
MNRPVKPAERRRFLSQAGMLMLSPALALPGQAQAEVPVSLYLSAATDSRKQHWLKSFRLRDGLAEPAYQHRLPTRAHHVAADPVLGIYIVLARRPGTWLQVGDLADGSLLHELPVPENRRFNGHGIFAAESSYFFTTESDISELGADSGRIGVWQVQRQQDSVSFKRVREFPSYGLDPHELLLLPDHRTLVIANGGILGSRDDERAKLNIDSMRPSLAYVDSETGMLLEQHYLAPEFHQASIRHLDVNAAGEVAIAMQFEGEPFIAAPLVASHRRGELISLPAVPEEIRVQMKQYCGSVRFDSSGRYFAVSCPRGNLITFWDMRQGKYLATVRSRDVCGVCAGMGGFVFSTGIGRISYYDPGTGEVRDYGGDLDAGLFWDNHLTMTEVMARI